MREFVALSTDLTNTCFQPVTSQAPPPYHISMIELLHFSRRSMAASRHDIHALKQMTLKRLTESVLRSDAIDLEVGYVAKGILESE